MSLINPTISKCSACGDECKARWTGLGAPWRNYLVYLAIWFAIHKAFFEDLPWTFDLALGIPTCIFLAMSLDRVYHAYWVWRHPTRCDGGGHAEPEPSRA